MLISDHFFLLYFFPAVLAIQLLIHKKQLASKGWALVTSIVFYATFHVHYVPLLIGLLVADYYAVKLLLYLRQPAKKGLLWLGIASNLAILGYYKYSVFVVESIRQLWLQNWIPDFTPATIMPVGISFFTFQRISYWVDVYRSKTKPANNLLDYLVYAAFFPQLIAGPIVRYADIRRQLKHKMLSWLDMYASLKLISIGLFVKAFIADNLYVLENDLANELARLTTLSITSLIGLFSLRIYFDFLGYSLLALGLARMFGFTFPINFASPYKAINPQDFWRRWNITLSDWLRDYLYIPLGGNRISSFATYRNVMITMLLAGLWHGASWSMVAWGAIHGIGLVAHRLLSNHSDIQSPKRLSQLGTWIFVTLAWIPFKFTKVAELELVAEAFRSMSWYWYDSDRINLAINTIPTIGIAMLWITKIEDAKLVQLKPSTKRALGFLLLFIFSLAWSLKRRSVPFIYFQF